ncbi:DUF4359 domain-containing protein [Pantanalinema rosaneae CENA516]|uniref:DUF4359 domain-containing protein n=1 Tax=Pantanalinema rosaneae TaxID=1620701 RepID=UPI003D6E4108
MTWNSDTSWHHAPRSAINYKNVILTGGMALLGLAGIMVATNPTDTQYERFATQELSTYLEENICGGTPLPFGLGSQCAFLLRSNQPQIQRVIAKSTYQQNFLFFSLYTTTLSLDEALPMYHIETVGVLQNFHTFKIQEKSKG